MIRVLAHLALAFAVLGCSAAAPATDLVPSPLQGWKWRVVAIDGWAPESRPADDGSDPAPAFTFGMRSYGGSAGCNALGGLYAQVDDRLYTMLGPQTAMGCSGARKAQEDAANAIFYASPEVRRSGKRLTLNGGGHTMELERTAPASYPDSPEAWQGPGILGQSYVVHEVNGRRTDGKRIWSKTPPRLRFTSERVEMRLDCPQPATGRFAPSTETIDVAGLSPTCRAKGTRDAELAAILAAARFVSGPNGELLLASRAGWAILWNERRDRPK